MPAKVSKILKVGVLFMYALEPLSNVLIIFEMKSIAFDCLCCKYNLFSIHKMCLQIIKKCKSKFCEFRN